MKKYTKPIASLRTIPPSRSLRGFGAQRTGKRYHCGTDLLSSYGTTVYCIEKGIVKNVFLFTYPALDRYNTYEKTYAVAIQHEDGNYALYAEMQQPTIKIGQHVKPGQPIGKVGRIFAHRPTHTMLHFEYHSRLPTKTTQWRMYNKPRGLLSSTIYLKNIIL